MRHNFFKLIQSLNRINLVVQMSDTMKTDNKIICVHLMTKDIVRCIFYALNFDDKIFT